MAQIPSLVRYWTQYLVGDPQMSTYSLQMYADAINFACKDYAMKTGATYLESSVTPDANGFCLLPSDYIRCQRVLYGGTELVESTFSFEDAKSNTWQTYTQSAATFPPRRWVPWSGAKIKLTPIPTGTASATIIGFVQTPSALSEATAAASAMITGKSYYIVDPGSTSFTAVGATSNATSVQFVATGTAGGTGIVADVIDLRIPDSHNEFLKYAAAAWLFQLDGDGQDFQAADAHMAKFNQLIGFSDPVLEAKLKMSRTQPEREM